MTDKELKTLWDLVDKMHIDFMQQRISAANATDHARVSVTNDRISVLDRVLWILENDYGPIEQRKKGTRIPVEAQP